MAWKGIHALKPSLCKEPHVCMCSMQVFHAGNLEIALFVPKLKPSWPNHGGLVSTWIANCIYLFTLETLKCIKAISRWCAQYAGKITSSLGNICTIIYNGASISWCTSDTEIVAIQFDTFDIVNERMFYLTLLCFLHLQNSCSNYCFCQYAWEFYCTKQQQKKEEEKHCWHPACCFQLLFNWLYSC